MIGTIHAAQAVSVPMAMPWMIVYMVVLIGLSFVIVQCARWVMI